MRMKNCSTNPVTIPANLTVGWRGKSDATFTVPPGGIVEIANGYACRSRIVHSAGSNPQVMPSIAERLSGGALKPYGTAAADTYRRFTDELPEVVAEMARHRVGDMGVAASTDAKAEAAKREAMEIGFRMMAAAGRLADEDKPQQTPRVYTEEELPPDA